MINEKYKKDDITENGGMIILFFDSNEKVSELNVCAT